MQILLRKILKNILVIAGLITFLLFIDNVILNNILSKRILEIILSGPNFKVKIENFAINYLSGKFQARNTIITNAQNKILAKFDIREANFRISAHKQNKSNSFRYELNLVAASATLGKIDLPSIKIENDPIDLSGYKIQTFYKLVHKKYQGEIKNNLDEKISFEITPLKTILSSKSFQCNAIKIAGEMQISYNKNNIIDINCLGKINNKNAIYLDLQNYRITNKQLKTPYIKFNLDSIIGDICYNFNTKKLAANRANITLDISQILASHIPHTIENKCVILNLKNDMLNANMHNKGKGIDLLPCLVFNLNTRSYDFTISGSVEGIAKEILPNYDKSSKLLNAIFSYLHQEKLVPKFLVKGNLKNINQSLEFDAIIPEYFKSFFSGQGPPNNNLDLHLNCNLNLKQKLANLCLANKDKIIEATVVANFCQEDKNYAAHLSGELKLNEKITFRECVIQKCVIHFAATLQDSKQGGYIINTNINLQNCLFDAIFIEKTKLHPFLCRSTIHIENDLIKSYVIFTQNKSKNIIEGNINIGPKSSHIDLKKVAYKNNSYKANIHFSQPAIKIDIDGEKIDFSELDLLSFLKHFIRPEQKISITCKIAEILMKNDNVFQNTVLDLNFDKNLVYNCDLSTQTNGSGTLNIKTNPNPNVLLDTMKKSSFEISASNFGSIMSSIGIKDIVEGGQLKAEINIKDDLTLGRYLDGKIHINSFYINNPPKILQVLSFTIFAPFFFQQKKALFHKLKSKFSLQQGELSITNLFANGPTFSFSIAKGKFADQTLECNGYIIPSFIIPNMPFIPVPYKHKKKYSFDD
jgi:hypothetical protein